MAWAAFVAAIVMSVANGTPYYNASEAMIVALLGQAVALLGLPTIRNIAEHRDNAKVERESQRVG